MFGRERAFGVGSKLMRTTDPQLFEMFVFALLSVSEAGEETRRSKRWECVGPDLNRTSETSIIMRHASHASRDTKERAFRSAWDRI